MAGEWIQIDCNIATKAEVEELIDLTGCERELIVGRMVALWAWSAMNCAEGSARMTVGRLCRMFGGDDTFWAGVQRVGWLDWTDDGETVAIPGWERRFSKSAKNRVCHADRAAGARAGAQKRTGACAKAHEAVRESALELGELDELGEDPPPPRVGFAELREAWNKGPGRRWTPHKPPAGAEDRLAEPGWFTNAVQAIERLRVAKFFKTPPTLIQFIGEGFVERVLGGQYDAAKTEKGGFTGGKPGSTDYRPPAEWTGDDAARFEATKRRELERLARAAAS